MPSVGNYSGPSVYAINIDSIWFFISYDANGDNIAALGDSVTIIAWGLSNPWFFVDSMMADMSNFGKGFVILHDALVYNRVFRQTVALDIEFPLDIPPCNQSSRIMVWAFSGDSLWDSLSACLNSSVDLDPPGPICGDNSEGLLYIGALPDCRVQIWWPRSCNASDAERFLVFVDSTGSGYNWGDPFGEAVDGGYKPDTNSWASGLLTDGKYYRFKITTVDDADNIGPPSVELGIWVSSTSAEDFDDPSTRPNDLVLFQNYPNPFNPETVIKYRIPKDASIVLEIYNVLSQRIRLLFSGPAEKGYHQVIWDGKDDNGTDVANGIYFYRIKAGDFSDVKKMVLLK